MVRAMDVLSSARRLTHPATTLLLVLAVLASLLLIPSGASAQPTGASWAVERFEATDGPGISTVVARRAWADTDTVVMARGDDYADALAASPVAALLDAPLLLTDRDTMPTHVWEQIEHFLPSRVVLMGGPAAVSDAVVDELHGWGVQTVERIAGSTRFGTAAAAMDFVRANGGTADPFVVRGTNRGTAVGWADAVAVSQHAASIGAPILLTEPDALVGPTRDALAADQPDTITIVGGEAAVDATVSDALWEIADVARLAGASRYHTSLAVADATLAAGTDADTLWLVNGENWQDALVAGANAASRGGVLVFANPHVWDPSPGRDWILSHLDEVDQVNVVGDRAVLPTSIDFELVDRATPTSAWIPPSGVRITPSDNPQAIVDANPPGTTFVFTNGVHHGVQVAPRDGDRFTGETGAVLYGAVSLAGNVANAYQDADGRWVVPGVTYDPPTPDMARAEDGREGEMIQTDLWAGRHRLTHTGERQTLTRSGQWHLDTVNDQVVLFDDPATLGALELSVTPWAFRSTAVEAEIDHLTIRRYATMAKEGAIDAHNGTRWHIHHVTVSESKSAGIRSGAGALITDSRLVHNGQIAITGGDHRFDGYQEPVRIERNEIAFNGEVGYRWGWEAGGAKMTNSIDSVFEQNWAHNNRGPGLWCDLDCLNPHWYSNLSEHNYAAGILIEETVEALAESNIVRGNGEFAWGDLGSGIWVANSPGVELAWNVFESNRLPIVANHNGIPAGEHGVLEIADLTVRNNDIRIDAYLPGLRVRTDEPERYRRDDIVWQDNVYRLRADRAEHFWWGQKVTVEQWQDDLQHDLEGEFLDVELDAFTPPRPFQVHPYGNR